MRRNKITDGMLKLMSESDRAEYSGISEVTSDSPSVSRKLSPLERDEHKLFLSWLSLHGYMCVRHSRTDKPTREPEGVPDFSVYDKFRSKQERMPIGKVLLIEFKLPPNKPELVQELWASNCGAIVHIAASAQEAISLVKKYFGE